MDTHRPLAVVVTEELPDWPFIECTCGQTPIFTVWLRHHWTGDKADAINACRELTRVLR